jgi:azurin
MEIAVKLLVPVLLAGLMLAPAAHARVCAVSIDSTDQMSFSQKEIKVGADCSQVKLTLRRTTLADSYLPKGDARVLAHTAVIGGGQTTSVTFSTAKLAKGGDYTFFCSFPGHFAMMKGKLVFG